MVVSRLFGPRALVVVLGLSSIIPFSWASLLRLSSRAFAFADMPFR